MNLKKNLSFEELVNVNREEILQDESRLDEIEEHIETKLHNSMHEKIKND